MISHMKVVCLIFLQSCLHNKLTILRRWHLEDAEQTQAVKSLMLSTWFLKAQNSNKISRYVNQRMNLRRSPTLRYLVTSQIRICINTQLLRSGSFPNLLDANSVNINILSFHHPKNNVVVLFTGCSFGYSNQLLWEIEKWGVASLDKESLLLCVYFTKSDWFHIF